uniref:Uncharacterized protein n=1 Tax=Amphimedon queenslandica TaxID=400682 RepID=A0A1X7UXW3_AMPQE
ERTDNNNMLEENHETEVITSHTANERTATVTFRIVNKTPETVSSMSKEVMATPKEDVLLRSIHVMMNLVIWLYVCVVHLKAKNICIYSRKGSHGENKEGERTDKKQDKEKDNGKIERTTIMLKSDIALDLY